MKLSAMIELRHPATVPAAQVLAFHTAFAERGVPVHGSSLAGFATLAEWLAFVDAPAGTRHPQGYEKVADSTFVAWHKTQQRVCGIINIRHELNEFLCQYGGHIGYSTHPDDWGKGIATRMLALALEKTDALGIAEVLLTCAPENAASAAVIRKNGGVLTATVDFQGQAVAHYRIARRLP